MSALSIIRVFPSPVPPYHSAVLPPSRSHLPLPGNDEIENQLKRDRMMAKNEIKMLLLGAGESGKVRLHHSPSPRHPCSLTTTHQSTVLKQMKLIYYGGYNEQERDSYKEIIFSNTIQSMRSVFLPLSL